MQVCFPFVKVKKKTRVVIISEKNEAAATKCHIMFRLSLRLHFMSFNQARITLNSNYSSIIKIILWTNYKETSIYEHEVDPPYCDSLNSNLRFLVATRIHKRH